MAEAAGVQSARNERQKYDVIRTALLEERRPYESDWKDIAQYILPSRLQFDLAKTPGQVKSRRNHSMINNTAALAARTLKAGMHAGMTSPARPWMRITIPDQELAKFPAVNLWLSEVSRRVLTMYHRSNLYQALPVGYGDYGTFGTASVTMLDDDRDTFRFYTPAVGTYAIGLDARGRCTTYLQEYTRSVRQIVEQFVVNPYTRTLDWSKVSIEVKNHWDAGRYEERVEVCWLVIPNDERDTRRMDWRSKPWKSVYFERGKDIPTVLGYGGFDTFPAFAPRWEVTGDETYGSDCPGYLAIGDAKQLQVMERRTGTLLEKAVNPSLVGPSALRNSRVSLVGGDITYLDQRAGADGLKPIHEVRLEGYQHITSDKQRVEYRIQRAYFEDLWLMLQTMDRSIGADRPTAREIDERHEEKLIALGPVLERTNDELLDPLTDRAFRMMLSRKLIPQPPKELENMDLQIEYISILAQAQKLAGVVAQDRLLMSAANLMEAFPEVRHKVRVFQAVDSYADMLGTDPRLLRTDDEAEALAAEEREQAAAAVQAENAKNIAAAGKAASETQLSGDSALNRIVNGVPGVGVGV